MIQRIPHAQKTSEEMVYLLLIPMIILLEVLLGNPCLFGLLGFFSINQYCYSYYFYPTYLKKTVQFLLYYSQMGVL